MNKFLKKIFITIVFIIFIVAFSSSYISLNIDNLAFVVALGIDTSDSKNIKVTFEFINPPSTTEGSSQDSKIIIDTVEASSITSAINIMNSYLAKKLDLSHCKTIVFSEEIAQYGLSTHIYSLMNDARVRPSSNIIISKCDATYYIENSVPSLETLVTKYYDIFPNSSKYTGYMANATIGDFFNALVCNYCQPYAILGSVANSNNSQSSKNTSDNDIKSGSSPISGTRNSENIGTAVFKSDKLVGELNAIETICFLVLQNNIESFVVSIPDSENENTNLDIIITPVKDTKVTVNMVNNTPYIKINATFSGKLYSMSKDSKYLDTSVLTRISNACNNYLKSAISQYLYKTSTEFKSDINGLGKNVLYKFFTNQDFENYNWNQNYINSTFEVNVDTNINSGLLLTET